MLLFGTNAANGKSSPLTLLASRFGREFSTLLSQALDTGNNWSSSTRSVGDQLLDALTLEAAAAQSEPISAARSQWERKRHCPL